MFETLLLITRIVTNSVEFQGHRLYQNSYSIAKGFRWWLHMQDIIIRCVICLHNEKEKESDRRFKAGKRNKSSKRLSNHYVKELCESIAMDLSRFRIDNIVELDQFVAATPRYSSLLLDL